MDMQDFFEWIEASKLDLLIGFFMILILLIALVGNFAGKILKKEEDER